MSPPTKFPGLLWTPTLSLDSVNRSGLFHFLNVARIFPFPVFSSDPHTVFLSPSLCLCSSSILPKMVSLNCSSHHITPGQDIFHLPLQTCSILLLVLGTDLDGPQQWPPPPLPWLLASGWIWSKGSTTRRSKGKENEVGVFIAPHGGVLLSHSVVSSS